MSIIKDNKTKLQREFEEQTPSIKNVESIEYLQTFITWLHLKIEKLQNANSNTNTYDFVKSCYDITEYIDGKEVAERFKNFMIPVIEYNELCKAAENWDTNKNK